MEAKSNNSPKIGERADTVQQAEATAQSLDVSRNSRITVYFALLFLQFLPLKHSLASQRTDNKIVETLGEKYHTEHVCLGDICDIWLGDVIENVRMIKDPYGEKTRGEKYRKDEVYWECLVLQLTEVLSRESFVRNYTSKERNPDRFQKAMHIQLNTSCRDLPGESMKKGSTLLLCS